MKDITYIPKNMCPLGFIREMGERSKKSWFFLHRNVIDKLKHTENLKFQFLQPNYLIFTYDATAEFPSAEMVIQSNLTSDWFWLASINASNILFDCPPTDPDEVLFLKMEE